MSIYLIVLISVTLLALLWNAVIAPWLGTRGVNIVLLESVTLLIREAVEFAEDLYKKDNDTDRRTLATKKIFELMWKANIDPGVWEDDIEWLMDTAISRLPKTHM